MKEERGITLIKLCFLIVIIAILFVMMFSALKSSFEATDIQKFVVQMELLQEKVNLIRREYKLWNEYDPNEVGNYHLYLESLGFTNANTSPNLYLDEFNKIIENLTIEELEYWDKDTDHILANYYYFEPKDLKDKFGLKNFDNYIIINFYTGNIIAKNPVKDVNTGKMVYRQYDAAIGNKLDIVPIINEETVVEVSVLENYGLSQKIKVALKSTQENVLKPNIKEIYYYKNGTQDEIRKKCTGLVDYVYNSKEKFATFTIDKTGKYSFVVEDSNSTEYPRIDFDITLCNSPEMLPGFIGVYWDDAGTEYSIANTYDSNWYSYSKDNFKMANAKDAEGNYWVWIPRFIYEENANSINIDFAKDNTMISTRNVATNTYKLYDAFDMDTKGFWIAKYQGNVNKNKLSFKPGKTLTIVNKTKAEDISNKLMDSSLAEYARLGISQELDAAGIIAKAYGIEIANDLVHYAGGSPNEKEIVNNTKYSSTNNIFGVFDLNTSETEITQNSNEDEGRFRLILVKE